MRNGVLIPKGWELVRNTLGHRRFKRRGRNQTGRVGGEIKRRIRKRRGTKPQVSSALLLWAELIPIYAGSYWYMSHGPTVDFSFPSQFHS